jgi:RND family efflux transporter MFP subunit
MLLSIADLSTVWVTADIYEEHLPLLGSMTDQIVTIRNKSLPDRVFEARVFYTGEVMDEASRTISLRGIADNPDHLLKPGMFITVELSGASEIDVLQIPVSAIQEYEGQKFVFVHIAADQFERRNILVGDSNSSSVVILSGLNVGEKVVTDGGFLLKSLMLAELMGEE